VPSATPGDVYALGFYINGVVSIRYWGLPQSASMSKSTITWPSVVSSDSHNGTIEYAISFPTTFIKYNSNNRDWYYTGDSSTDNTRWQFEKMIYDPCPSGWRVPDGGTNGVWSKALGSCSYFEDCPFDDNNKGIDFSGIFGPAATIWYPSSGCRYINDCSLNLVGNFGNYWSASPKDHFNEHYMSFYNAGYVDPSNYNLRASFLSVRCVKANDDCVPAKL
jgi:hypothetical protein